MAITIPVDKKQCQAMKPNGCSFMTLGGVPKRERCENVPDVIVRENEPGDDGLRGEMSLCNDCHGVMKEQMPAGFATAEDIVK